MRYYIIFSKLIFDNNTIAISGYDSQILIKNIITSYNSNIILIIIIDK
jgi:hypothetical protein